MEGARLNVGAEAEGPSIILGHSSIYRLSPWPTPNLATTSHKGLQQSSTYLYISVNRSASAFILLAGASVFRLLIRFCIRSPLWLIAAYRLRFAHQQSFSSRKSNSLRLGTLVILNEGFSTVRIGEAGGC